MQVVYAEKIAKVPFDMDWPEWVCDIPQPGSVITAGAPICTVIAEARTAKMAKQKVLQRAASL
jgi:predicted ATP-grasp superfamily ATP-dependent carboligase